MHDYVVALVGGAVIGLSASLMMLFYGLMEVSPARQLKRWFIISKGEFKTQRLYLVHLLSGDVV